MCVVEIFFHTQLLARILRSHNIFCPHDIFCLRSKKADKDDNDNDNDNDLRSKKADKGKAETLARVYIDSDPTHSEADKASLINN